jgi:hypothetical protein
MVSAASSVWGALVTVISKADMARPDLAIQTIRRGKKIAPFPGRWEEPTRERRA